MFHGMIATIIFFVLALIGAIVSITGIGGTFVVLAGALIYNLVSWSWTIGWTTLAWLLALALLGELLEWIITAMGTKKGASHYAVAGTIIGAILGSIALSIIPVLGTIAGLILGAVLGAFIMEWIHTGKMKKAWKAAKTAMFGRVMVSLSKVLITIIQILIVARIII